MTPATKHRAYTPATTSGFMTPRNHSYYLVLWGAVRANYPQANRHDLHRQALGYEASSKSFTQTEWRKVRDLFKRLGKIKSDTKKEEAEKLYRFALRRYGAAIDADDAYLEGIFTKMGRIGGLRTWNSLDEHSIEDLERILIAVMKKARRLWANKDRLWQQGICREFVDQDIDNTAAEAIVRSVLRCGAIIPPPDKWSYEEMLAVLGELKQKALHPA